MPNHSFDIFLAAEYGIEEAILIQHFQFWILKNKELKRNFHEGRTWTYETLQEIAAHFPYLSSKKVERLILRLIKLKIILKGNFNKNQFDRTAWYAFENEEMFAISRYREMEVPISGNGSPDIGKCNKDTDTISISNTISDICISAHARIDCGKVDKSICRAPLVFTTDDEHKKLVKVHGEDFIQKAYIHLSEWKQDTPKVKWKGNDYRSILRWVIDVIRDKDLKKKDLPINQEENHSLAQHISVKYQGRKERDIVIGQDYLEFINGPQCEHIKYKDKDFTERVKHQLNKRGLDTEWIKWLKD